MTLTYRGCVMDRRLLAWAALGLFSAGLLTPAAAQDFPYSEPLEFPEELEEEEADEIETDRDSCTPATTTSPWGRFIVEAAHSFVDNRRVAETHSYPELIVRYGLSDWIELRLGWNYEVGGAGSPVSGNVPSDFED